MWLYQNVIVKRSECEYTKLSLYQNVNIKNLVVSKFEHTKINLVTGTNVPRRL